MRVHYAEAYKEAAYARGVDRAYNEYARCGREVYSCTVRRLRVGCYGMMVAGTWALPL